MNKEELFQKFCEGELENFTKVLKGAAEEAISAISYEYLPHLATDTECNIDTHVNQVLGKLLRGDFTVDEHGYLHITEPYTYLNIRVTQMQWDKFRAELIKLMPVCPKDQEIASLKEQLKSAYERNW